MSEVLTLRDFIGGNTLIPTGFTKYSTGQAPRVAEEFGTPLGPKVFSEAKKRAAVPFDTAATAPFMLPMLGEPGT